MRKISNSSDEQRINEVKPLVPPACVKEDFPLDEPMAQFVEAARQSVSEVIQGRNDRLICIVGPCSIHDVNAAREYAARLASAAKKHRDDLLIVMRVYFEKPRTTVGWKGLINDPDLDGTCKINKGLRLARSLLLDINKMGIPVGVEWLDTITPQFISDLVTWGAIGARTTESQVHRQMASGLAMPVGFKNGTDGSIQVAVDAVVAARAPHSFLSVTMQGLAAIVNTSGNQDCHMILRGGRKGPNYEEEDVRLAQAGLEKVGVHHPAVLVDCSHGNSLKDHTRQPLVCNDVCRQVSKGSSSIIGVMIESNLLSGNQKLTADNRNQLIYGQSITDACVDWSATETMLETLAAAVKARRALRNLPNK